MLSEYSLDKINFLNLFYIYSDKKFHTEKRKKSETNKTLTWNLELLAKLLALK